MQRRGEPYISPNEILKHFPVQRQISYDLLQLGVLILQRSQPAHLVRQKTPIFFFQLKYVAWLIPALRQIYATGVPCSLCFRTKAFCASVNFDAFM